MNATNSLLGSALAYQRRGFSVIPLSGKTPCEPWAEFQQRRASEDEVKAWWRKYPNANIGLVCGHISKIMVLDVDPRNGGDKAIHGLALPVTPSVKTGGGGWHYYFPCRNGTPKIPGLLQGVDLQANRSYVVAPPSVHPETGKPYAFADGLGLDIPLATIPIWLSDALLKHASPKIQEIRSNVQSDVVLNGNRNNHLTSLAGSMRRRGMGEEAIFAALMVENKEKCRPELPENEIRVISRSVSRYVPGEPLAQGGQEGKPETSEPREDPPTPVEFLKNEPRDIVRLKTGLQTLDEATRGGIPTGIVSSLLGGPHVGKTALASQIAKQVSMMGFLSVILFKDEGRFAGSVRLGQQLGLDRSKLELRDEEEMKKFEEVLKAHKIRIPDPDSKDWTLEKTIAWAEKEAEGPWLLVIDSVQSVYIEKTLPSLREGIAFKYELLERAAKRGSWVIAISEMNRSAYRHKDDALNSDPMAAGAEGRAIEYTSRVILNLSGDAQAVVTAKIVKNSPGGTRLDFFLKFDPVTATFKETSEDDAETIRDVVKAKDEERKASRIEEKILKALANGELNTRALRKAVGGDVNKVSEVRDQMAADGRIWESSGMGKERFYSLPTGSMAPSKGGM